MFTAVFTLEIMDKFEAGMIRYLKLHTRLKTSVMQTSTFD